MLLKPPAEIATTLVSCAGTMLWPYAADPAGSGGQFIATFFKL